MPLNYASYLLKNWKQLFSYMLNMYEDENLVNYLLVFLILTEVVYLCLTWLKPKDFIHLYRVIAVI